MPVVDREWTEFRRRVDDAVLVGFAMVRESLARATASLLDEDKARAKQVVAEDRDIDEHCAALSAMVKERLTETIGRPAELEELVLILQMIPELERSADLAEHIARRAIDGLGARLSPRPRGLIQSMNDTAVGMWLTAAAGYEQRSRDTGYALAEADDELDGLAADLVEEAIGSVTDSRAAAELVLLARFYERSGDHAVNLAKRVESMVAPRRVTAARLISGRP
ncbi:MAG TPA: PhoU domain-containing protein, partial [Acidimicrobiales bacterium]|nr:PhoU domain-containing protein [Acidimicrobiales bacterium]